MLYNGKALKLNLDFLFLCEVYSLLIETVREEMKNENLLKKTHLNVRPGK